MFDEKAVGCIGTGNQPRKQCVSYQTLVQRVSKAYANSAHAGSILNKKNLQIDLKKRV